MDRPSRKTKVVNYTEAKDYDEDEDFAFAKAPPSKKAREDAKQEHKKSLGKSSSQGSNSQTSNSQKNRRPLDERLHDRDLEAAIALSLLNDMSGEQNQSSPAEEANKVQVPVDENTDPSSLLYSNCSVDVAALGLDEITSEENKSHAPPRQRKPATEAPRKVSSDEEDSYEPTLDSESDEDFSEPSESEDEEFTVKKSSKAKKEKATKEKAKKPQPVAKKEKQPKQSKPKPQAAAASTPVRSPPMAKVAPKRPATTSVVPRSKPSVSVSPAGGRVPKWTPPAQVGKSSSTSQSPAGRSPGQGLRLGLSRLVRVKPLHPSVASH